MTVHTVRPNDEGHTGWNAGGYSAVNATPAGSLAAATRDDNPLSFIVGVGAGSVILGFANYTLGASERCRAVRARLFMGSAQSVNVRWMLGNFTAGKWAGDITAPVGSAGEFDGLWVTADPGTNGEWLQAALDAINIEIFSGLTSDGDTALIAEAYMDFDVRVKPSVALDAATSTNTHWPTVHWTPTIGDGQAQIAAHVKVFDLSKNPSPVVTDTLGLAYDSGLVGGTSTQRTIVKGANTGLANGTYKVFVQVAKDFNGTQWWSTWASNTMTVSAGVIPPSSLKVLDDNTDLPRVQCFVTGDHFSTFYATAKAEYQFATDAGFTTNVRGFIGPNSDFTRQGTVTDTVPSDQALFQGTWYVRARAIDNYGSVSTWSSTISTTIAHPPVPTQLAPVGGKSIVYNDGVVTFSWAYFNRDASDTQTAYQIVIVDGDGNTIVDTGKIVSTEQTGDVTLPATAKDQVLRWLVNVWDSQDVENDPYTTYAPFLVADAPTVMLTAPLDGGTVNTPAPEIDWTFAATSRTQAAFRISVANAGDGTLVFDTGWIEGDDTTYVPTVIALNKNLASFTIYLQVRDSTDLEGDAQATVATDWDQPQQPICTVDASLYDSNGYVEVDWDASTEDIQWYAWRVYRKRVDEVNWELVAETSEDLPNYIVRDFLAENQQSYVYAVVQVALRFGMQVESVYDNAPQADLNGDTYWLIALDDFTASVRLDQVTEDSFTSELERAELNVWGRGRHVDKGQRWGLRGQLVAELYDTDAVLASDAITALLYATDVLQTNFMLRPPFGRLWKVDGGDVQVERIPGVGKMEAATVTVPYVEVYD